MAAARLCWALLFAGVRRVRLLDGGLDAWLAFGGATVRECPLASELGTGDSLRPSGTPAPWQSRLDLLATTEDIARHVDEEPGGEPITLVVARLLGLRAKNYDGGFYGWSWEDCRPIETEPRPPLLFPR